MRACMGGFCAQRERCASYQSADWRNPVERQCSTGMYDRFIPQKATISGNALQARMIELELRQPPQPRASNERDEVEA